MINDYDMVSRPLLDMKWTSQSIITMGTKRVKIHHSNASANLR